jgi:cytochrome c-type biogenesis protein CcmH/NrfG
MAKQKLSAKQREARLEAAQRREAAVKAQKEKKERAKRIGVIVVCVILVLALCIPTVALSFLGGSA